MESEYDGLTDGLDTGQNSAKNYEISDIESESDYFKNNFESFSEYEKVKKTRMLTHDKAFLKNLKSKTTHSKNYGSTGGNRAKYGTH
jgi:hypothetical protein